MTTVWGGGGMKDRNVTPRISRRVSAGRGLVSYAGTRDELLAAGAVLSQMFPNPPKRR